MYLSGLFGRISGPLIAILIAGSALANPTGISGHHDHQFALPDGCQFGAHETGSDPAAAMQAFGSEIGLTGQQQKDLQILAMDYAERLRDLAKLMGEGAKKLATTQPGDPDYWPLTQEVSASAAASTAETIILVSEMREKFSAVLTTEQRAELKRKIDERIAQCKPATKAEPTETD